RYSVARDSAHSATARAPRISVRRGHPRSRGEHDRRHLLQMTAAAQGGRAPFDVRSVGGSNDSMTVELFTMSIGETAIVEMLSQRAEAAGWDGITFVDSQNLVGDPFVAIALGAKVTDRLQFMTGVTNPANRHPAALATVAA